MKKKVLVVFGTRPEAIKMAPVVQAFHAAEGFETKVCVTAQHRQMLDQVMAIFGLAADFDLDVMAPDQTLAGLTGKVLAGMDRVLSEWRPDLVLVQGDTTTVMSAALAAFYHKVDVGHVEAGLRTGNRFSPWPEEMNRLLATRIASWHFAPTAGARDNLLREGVDPATVFVTGNTVIDALHAALAILDADDARRDALDQTFEYLDPTKRLVLVTGHRRENFGDGFLHICRAIARLAAREDVQLVYPMHMNPNVRRPVNEILGASANVHLIEPLDYLSFLYLMRRSDIVLTDSGGVQEEAPSLGKPVVVMRDTTERPEAVEAGTVVLSGPDEEKIVAYVSRLLDDGNHYASMSRANNPYGDGHASERIVKIARDGTL